jgi:hypothetical protein
LGKRMSTVQSGSGVSATSTALAANTVAGMDDPSTCNDSSRLGRAYTRSRPNHAGELATGCVVFATWLGAATRRNASHVEGWARPQRTRCSARA